MATLPICGTIVVVVVVNTVAQPCPGERWRAVAAAGDDYDWKPVLLVQVRGPGGEGQDPRKGSANRSAEWYLGSLLLCVALMKENKTIILIYIVSP